MTSPLQVTVVADATASDGAYSLLDIRAAAETQLPPHTTSREDGTLFVLSGEVEVVLPSLRQIVAAGNSIALPRGLPRRLCVLTEARMLWLCAPAGIEQLAELAAAVPPPDSDDLAALLAAAGISLLPPGWGTQPEQARIPQAG